MLLSTWLIFCQFESGIAYKSVGIKKACMAIRLNQQCAKIVTGAYKTYTVAQKVVLPQMQFRKYHCRYIGMSEFNSFYKPHG